MSVYEESHVKWKNILCMSLYKDSHVKIKSNDYFLVVCGHDKSKVQEWIFIIDKSKV